MAEQKPHRIESYVTVQEALDADVHYEVEVTPDLTNLSDRVITRVYIPVYDPDEGCSFERKQDWDEFVAAVQLLDRTLQEQPWKR